MPRRLPSTAAARALPFLAALALGACAHHRVAVLDAPPSAVLVAAPALPAAPAGPSPINANLSAAATVWHLRAALNVAALACRAPGEAMLAGQYNALLVRQKASFAAAQEGLQAEFRAGGGDWRDRYDHAMTRLYNFFSTAPAHDRFCAAAMEVMTRAQSAPPGALPGVAAGQLADLDAAFAPAEGRPAFGGRPQSQPVFALTAAPTATQPTAHPRLDLDLSALPGD